MTEPGNQRQRQKAEKHWMTVYTAGNGEMVMHSFFTREGNDAYANGVELVIQNSRPEKRKYDSEKRKWERYT